MTEKEFAAYVEKNREESRKRTRAAFPLMAEKLSRICSPGVRGELLEEANDDTPDALAAAYLNAYIVEGSWCDCQRTDGQAYFRNPVTGGHGWACPICLRIIQTG